MFPRTLNFRMRCRRNPKRLSRYTPRRCCMLKIVVFPRIIRSLLPHRARESCESCDACESSSDPLFCLLKQKKRDRIWTAHPTDASSYQRALARLLLVASGTTFVTGKYTAPYRSLSFLLSRGDKCDGTARERRKR